MRFHHKSYLQSIVKNGCPKSSFQKHFKCELECLKECLHSIDLHPSYYKSKFEIIDIVVVIYKSQGRCKL